MIRRVSFLTFSLLATSLSYAEVPSSVLFQGYLTNNDAPVNGSQTLLVKACDALVDGNCKTVFNDKVQASNGYYTALLQNLPTLDKPYWLEVVSNGSLLSERIALTATPYALRAAVADSSAKVGTATKAIFADSATGALRAASALTALNADLATRAKLADSAIAALQAVNATLAAKATLADSAISALRAVNATLAAKALFADSATGAVRAVSAINATNATNAVNAVNATNATLATKAILADSATGAVRAVSAINATNATNADNVVGGYLTSLNTIQGTATISGSNNISVNRSGSTLTIVGPSVVANAINATNATLAAKATLADSATGAIRAVTATNAEIANSIKSYPTALPRCSEGEIGIRETTGRSSICICDKSGWTCALTQGY
ncbi:MAG: hypothetical protein RL318_331 [Fibrobacterota bacterium]